MFRGPIRALFFALSAIALALPLRPTAARADEPLRVAVAANFKPTLEALHPDFTRATGIAVSLSGASTGVLSNQIRHGAPFDVFFAADTVHPAMLASLDLPGAGTPFCYAVGKLVLAGGELADLARADRSLAIANPATAPYGQAALQVLARPQFAAGETRKLVRGNSVAQAVQFWHTGAVDLVLAPQSLVPEGTPVPGDWHAPVEQHAMALTDDARVARYLEWLGSATVRASIIEAGYEPCP